MRTFWRCICSDSLLLVIANLPHLFSPVSMLVWRGPSSTLRSPSEIPFGYILIYTCYVLVGTSVCLPMRFATLKG